MRLPTGQNVSPVLPCLTFSVLPIMTVAPTYIIYIPLPNTHLFTNHHGGAHDSSIPDSSLFHFKIRHRSRDFRVGHTTSNYRFPSSASSDEERPPEGAHVKHSATEEEVHFHYQSRRGRCTLWTPLFLHTTNHHGRTHHSSLHTPNLYTLFQYNLHGRTLFAHPSSLHTFKLPVTTDAPITLSTPLTSTYFSATNHDGAHSLDTPILYQSTRTHTLLLSTPPHSYIYTQLWSL